MGTDSYNSIIAKKVFLRHAIGLLQLSGAATAYFYSKNNIIQYTYYSTMFPTLEDIAKRRRQLGLKQSELAKAAGVSQSLIAKLEAGTIDSSYSKVRTIFDVLERLEFKTKVQAEKVLHNDVITVQKNEPISEVVKIMKENGISQVPVFDGKQSVGSISEKAILHQILAGQDLEEISRQPTEKIMEEAFPQINEDAPLSLITSLLQTYSAVLVSRKGDIIGIITKADLLRML
jgi:predicted transcriptional regulator